MKEQQRFKMPSLFGPEMLKYIRRQQKKHPEKTKPEIDKFISLLITASRGGDVSRGESDFMTGFVWGGGLDWD